MGHTFELIDGAPRPTSALRHALLSVDVLSRLQKLAAGIELAYRERFPQLDAQGRDADRARQALQAFVDAESIHRWLADEGWPAGQDTAFISRSSSRARRRLRRALRRVGAMSAVPPTPRHARSAQPAPSPVLGAPAHPSNQSRSAVLVPLWAYRPAERWLELYGVLARLSQRRLLTRELFKAHGAESVWDWVNGRCSFSPMPEPYVWAAFTARPVAVGLARRLLPVWVGLMGTPRLEADVVEWALAEVGMANFAEQLSYAWDKALAKGASEVPWAALTLWPSHGSWSRLTRELQRWNQRRRSGNSD